jgi:hypothetical protein
MSSRHEPDSDRDEAVKAVKILHDWANVVAREGGENLTEFSGQLRDAAVLLDDYQAGLALVTPHPNTGCELVQWVSVDKELPADGVDVLIVYRDGPAPVIGFMGKGMETGIVRWSFSPSMPSRQTVVTHWAPIPDGPLAEESAA